MEKAVSGLKSNRMNVYIAENRDEARRIVLSLIPEGSSVASGGSVTLDQCGILDALRADNKYNFIDRYAPNVTKENRDEIFRVSAASDVYLTGANAIISDGRLYNVDGNSNRVAAIAYGPKKVIAVAGVNKIVPDLDAAIMRVKTSAAPKNAVRLGLNTYCASTGKCVDCSSDIGSGCKSPERICCNYLISGYQRHAGRINVVIVLEDLGL